MAVTIVADSMNNPLDLSTLHALQMVHGLEDCFVTAHATSEHITPFLCQIIRTSPCFLSFATKEAT